MNVLLEGLSVDMGLVHCMTQGHGSLVEFNCDVESHTVFVSVLRLKVLCNNAISQILEATQHSSFLENAKMFLIRVSMAADSPTLQSITHS